jgi:hypothetical protein
MCVRVCVEYYSAIKNNEIMLLSAKWMTLEIMLSEISQIEKDKCHLFFLLCEI